MDLSLLLECSVSGKFKSRRLGGGGSGGTRQQSYGGDARLRV